jgi:hypothetical protein
MPIPEKFLAPTNSLLRKFLSSTDKLYEPLRGDTSMTKIIALLLIIASASTTMADPLKRYVSTDYTCAELQDIVQQDGQINIVHRIGYGTYYADRNYCDTLPYNAEARPGYEPSSDQHKCFVGYRCEIHGN